MTQEIKPISQEIKLTTDQMKLMSLFQNITKATARDCIEDEKRDRIIFVCLLYTSPSPRDQRGSRMPSSA